PIVLQSLFGSAIDVTVGIPNAMLRSLSSNNKVADTWVDDNLTRYFTNGGRTVRIEAFIRNFQLCPEVANEFSSWIKQILFAVEAPIIHQDCERKNSKTRVGDLEMTTMKKWEIIHIPEKPQISITDPPCVDVVAAVIEPKLANTLIRQLNQTSPLENLTHVKRVRKISVEEGMVFAFVIHS
ncbi:hypothetical protein FRX31_015544, partial [Thalictrum thalictroides]